MSAPATECASAPMHRIHNSTSQPIAARDRFYGHQVFSEAAERYIMNLFSCSQDSVAATQEGAQKTSKDTPRLAHFIAYALYRTRLPVVVSYHALILLKRLKNRYPAARGSSGHRLFIAAYMLASKMVCDDSYNNKSWTIVCHGLLTLREVNQMERELLGYLALHINATPEELTEFASEFELYGAPCVTLEELCELRLLPSRATQPSFTADSKRNSLRAAATVTESKRMSTPTYTHSNPLRDSKRTIADCHSFSFEREKCVSPSSIPTSLPPTPGGVVTENKETLRCPSTKVEPAKVRPNLASLFNWVSRRDIWLLVVAIIAIFAAGCIPIVMTRVLGSAFAAFVQYNRSDPHANSELRRKVRDDSLILIGIAFGTVLFHFIATLSFRTVAERSVRRLRRLAFASLVKKEISWYDLGMGISADGKDVGAGGLLAIFNRDTDDVRMAIGVYVRSFLLHIATLCAGTVFALINCWDLTLVILASVPLLVATTMVTEIVGTPMLAYVRHNTSVLASFVETSTSQINTVKAYAVQDQQNNRFKATAVVGRRLYSRLSCVWGSRLGICSTLGLLTFVQGFGYGFHLVSTNRATPEIVVATFLATVLAMGQLQSALVLLSQIEKGKVAAAHIEVIMRSHTENKPEAEMRPPECRGEIVLHDVSFAYPSRPNTLVLDHVSMYFPAGEHTFVLGASGSGKSTIAQLVMGMYEPSAGHVVLDSQNMSHIDPQWRKEQICGVSQSSLVLEASLYDNVALGAPPGLARDRVYARVLEACTVMGIDEIARILPNGAETIVGRRGTALSGGQRQRLALARAYVRDPPVLILDEATSALDAASAARVHATIKHWRKNRTTIVITHTIAHVAPDDFCYLLADGRVVDSGFRFAVEQRGRQGALSRLFNAAKMQRTPPSSATLANSASPPASAHLPSPAISRSKAQCSTAVAMPTCNPRLGAIDAAIFVWRTLPNRLGMAAGLVCCMLSGLTTPVFSYFLTQVLLLLQTRDSSRVALLIGATAAAAVVDGLFKFARFSVMEILSAYWVYSVRKIAFSRVLLQDRAWYDKSENSASRLTTAVVKDTEDASAFLGYVVGQVTVVFAMVLGTLIYAFISGWQLTLCALGLLPFMLLIFIIQGVMAGRAERGSKRKREHVGDLVYDLASSVRELRAMALDRVLEHDFAKATTDAFNAGISAALVAASAAGLGESMTYVVEAVLYVVGGELLIHGVYDLHRFLIVINALVFAVAFSTSIASGIPATSKSVQAMLDARRLIVLEPDAGSDSKGNLHPPIFGDIDFCDVSFSYADGTRGIHNVSFSVHRGERVSLVGRSGCGKTTIAALLQRLYEPQSGTITIDGHALSTISATHLRSYLGVVGQSPVLFPATVAENIRCGASDAQITHAELVAAAQRARAHEFIEELPAGYNTVVGGTTSHLSGGQAQRIAVARAFARSARTLILDEFTASLDRNTADAVIDSVLGVRDANKSVLVITHDPRLMQRCDRIVVIDEGIVVEQGTYDELLASGGTLCHVLKTSVV
ncbi:ABC-type xenobiotic transporter [Malassezia cuniculi]|uniref:ABC-type xenobiotic transporter n=1 Tax=Malassezia cuniculi TaxID=948313 RepID=A0AAF0ER60_9BASI|nr:ABC-type xenobiotic transporter [Malassezia cuniculi]